ncbi:MAG: hypothetical protein WBY93_00020 [Candidatus Binatus sp.]
MTYFLIKYRFKNGTEEEWHQEVARFIAEINNDPALTGKITYRCMKSRNGPDYYHLASAADEQSVQTLQAREFFKRYTERTKIVADGELEVLPLMIIAETKR